ncbi:MAG: P1 family peptidase [Candidatus Limnocylindrales bacterium]
MTAEPTVRQSPPPPRRRVRELGLRIGSLPPGPTNTIADVADVTVGHRTVWRDEADPPAGRGTARTGITVIVPLGDRLPHERVPAGAAVLNGAGEAIGITSIAEWATLETPIFLTSSMAIGRVYDGAVATLAEAAPDGSFDDAIMPVVAECDDGDLNRPVPVQVDEADVRAALDDARNATGRAVPLGVVGAGTGMRAFEVKGGIGSASRIVRPIHRRSTTPAPDAPAFTLGVLVLANFGELERLVVDGVPVGAALAAEGWPEAGGGRRRRRARTNEGSCIVVVATDAPLFGHALDRLARRAGLGLARTGTTAHHGSGEIFLAFSTGIRFPRADGPAVRTTAHVDDEHLDPFFAAVVEATEEATLDAIFTADTVTGQAGRTVPGLPIEATLAILRAAGRDVSA